MTPLHCPTCNADYVPCDAGARLLACGACETLMVRSLSNRRLVGVPHHWFLGCEEPLDLKIALTGCFAELLAGKEARGDMPARRIDDVGVELVSFHVAVADFDPKTFGDTHLEREDWRRLAAAAGSLAGLSLARAREILSANRPPSRGITTSSTEPIPSGPPSSPRLRRTNDACAGCRARLVTPHSTTWLYECPWCAARVCATCATSRRCPACTDGTVMQDRWYLPRRVRVGAAFR